jgi:tetratricopeptide (TPR) repeat protein
VPRRDAGGALRPPATRGAPAPLIPILAGALLGAAACPIPNLTLGEIDAHSDLPDDPLELLTLAERLSRVERGADDFRRALAALDKAEALDADRYVTAVLRARTWFRIVERTSESQAWSEAVRQGIAAAETAVSVNPDRVEGHYYLASLLGRHAERATVGALDAIPRIEAEAQRAVDLDRTYDHCGPLLALGMLYVAAPPWPQSIGDAELGIEYLEEAVACSDFPVNRIFLAEALLDQGDFERARELLQWVLDRPPTGEWGVLGNVWRPQARDLLRRAENPGIE